MSAPDAHRGFWYGDTADARRQRAVDLLQALRSYRDAEVAMRRRTREAMAMGENDMATLRYLLRARQEGRAVSPGELARAIRVTTASMTAIIDRLERASHVRREQHATDRRSIRVIPTDQAEVAVRRTVGDMHTRMLDAVIDLSADEAEAVIRVLTRLEAAVDQVAADDPD